MTTRWLRPSNGVTARAGVGICVSLCLLTVAMPGPAAATGIRWRVLPSPADGTTSALTGISCTSKRFCMAVGVGQGGSGLLTEVYNGRGWRAHIPTADGDRSVLTSVSCRSSRWCLAVGYANVAPSGHNASGKLPLTEFWNGHAWRAQILQTSAGLSPAQWTLLEGVSCPSQSRCYAVGQEGPEQVDQELDLFATWVKGQGWTYQSLNDTQTITLNLSGVSCSTSTECFAVGQSDWKSGPPSQDDDLYYAFQNVNGVNQWAGTNTSGIYFGIGLNAVACVDGYNCMSVGQSLPGSGRSALLASVDFTLSTGTSVPVSAPAGATSASLNGIACTAPTNCTSVGAAEVNGRAKPLIENWNGHAWAIQPNRQPKAFGATLAAVSCPSARECFAVGDQQRSSTSKPRALIERRT